ncbi:MAG TPA: site-2 protease family protein [Candidatus Acidoferrum sp.]|nr:site-2 protease family protein [Candidatus Acidoferrum sp.]
MSSQDFSPAPYPLYADKGAGDSYVPLARRVRERYWLYSLLFALTVVTTCAVGASMAIDFERNMAFDIERSLGLWGEIWAHPLLLLRGLPFSFTLLGILLAHEFGHYLAAEFHGVNASLPYFLPSPFLGTFGAFIRVRSPIFSKRALFDIGIAGPLAGFVCLVPALAVGLAYSKIVPGAAHQSDIHFGVPVLEWLLMQAIFPGAAAGDICLHPIARAAWIGMFATAMNLLPIGQLDGGHILYSFFPKRHRLVSRMLCIAMLPCGILWKGWAFWGVVLFWLGRRHPVIEDPEPLDRGRGQLGLLALVVFALCLTLVPFSDGGF